MGLGIENVTLGYDAQGVNAYVNDIKTNLVDEACNKLKDGVQGLRSATNEVWRGKAADNFKNNMLHDVNLICDALQDSKEVLISELEELKTRMKELDENLVKDRSTFGDKAGYNLTHGPFGD